MKQRRPLPQLTNAWEISLSLCSIKMTALIGICPTWHKQTTAYSLFGSAERLNQNALSFLLLFSLGGKEKSKRG
jgi:hypothetical protein